LAPQVQQLRDFRDRYLLPHAAGRILVALYYTLSPPLAKLIAGSETLRAVVRVGLAPVVAWVALVLWSPMVGLAAPLVGLALGVRFVGCGFRRRRRVGADPRRGSRFQRLLLGLVAIGTLTALAGEARTAERLATPPAPPPPRSEPGEVSNVNPPMAEVTFPTPQRFLVVTEAGSQRQRLYGIGEVLTEAGEADHAVAIQRLEAKRVQLRDTRTRRVLWVAQGERIPGFTNRRITRIALLRGLDYQYVATASSLDAEPRVVAIRGERALLEVDVPPPRPPVAVALPRATGAVGANHQVPPLDRKLDATLLGRVRVKETGPHAYEVSAADLREALEHGGQVLAEAWPTIWPLASLRDGVGLQLQSPVADGVLGPRGFRVTSPNLAQRAGIEVGDVILAVNGQAVNSFGDLYTLYQQVRRDSRLSVVEVSLERQGVQMTNTYRVR
jgi:membrane-associated protease RseP (regulator of RpoE activity)